jgi:SAM-dependent methyltransferase
MKKITPSLLIIAFGLISCNSIFRPYNCGPVLGKDDLDIFRRQAEYLGLKPGVTFADIGASSGYHDGAMAVSTEGVTYYLSDIDFHCLNQRNMERVLKHFSRLKGTDIGSSNSFKAITGTTTDPKLPDNAFDVVFMNATLHVLDQPDSVLSHIYRDLKSGGFFFVRDDMVYDGTIRLCDPKKCGHPVLQYEPFIKLMTRNGFQLIDTSRDFGHPIFKFAKRTS